MPRSLVGSLTGCDGESDMSIDVFNLKSFGGVCLVRFPVCSLCAPRTAQRTGRGLCPCVATHFLGGSASRALVRWYAGIRRLHMTLVFRTVTA